VTRAAGLPRRALSGSRAGSLRLRPATEPCPATSSTKACTLARAQREAGGNAASVCSLGQPTSIMRWRARSGLKSASRSGDARGSGAPGTGTWCRIRRRSDRCAPAGTPALAEHVTVLPRFHRIPCRGDAWGARGVCVATGNPMATFARKRARARFAPKGRARAACAPVPALGATMPLRSTNGCAMVSGEQDLTQ